METRASHVLIGGFVIATVFAAVLFVAWLSKLSFDREWDYYDIAFAEAVTGLSVGSAVQYNGIQIGEVRALSLDPRDPRRAIARVRVAAGAPIRTDTRARLTFTGLTGVASIQLFGGSPASPPLLAAGDAEVATIVAEQSSIATLLSSGEEIAVGADALLQRLGALLSEKNISRLASTLEHVERITGAIAGESDSIRFGVVELTAASARLDRLLARIDATAASAQTAIGDIDRDVDATLADIRDAARSFGAASQRADTLLVANEAAVAQFAQQGLPELGAAISDLRATIAPLRRLAVRLEQDPSLLVTGSAATPAFAAP